MASNSKSINLDGYNQYIRRCTLTAYFNENSTSTANNTSNITCKASLYTPSASWDNGSGRDDHLRIYWHDNRENYDRLVATWSGSYVGVGATITAEGTIDVTHKDDGTLSGYAWATWSRDGGNTYYAPASGDVATDWTGLTTIARASQPTIGQAGTNVPDFDIGDTITIHMNRKSNSFTHTVTFNYGSTSVQVATGVANSCTFDTSTIANDLYALIPNDNVYSSTISVKTYNGSTLIGTKTCAYNAHVVNSDPIFTDFSYRDDTSATRTITGNNQYLIQNHSKLRVSISTTQKATARNSATMSRYDMSVAGVSETATYTTSTLYHTFANYFDVTNDQTCIVKAVDSRGNTTSVQKTIHFIPYSSPSIVATCERQSNFEANTNIHVAGAMSLIQVNGVTKNAVNSTSGIQYRYKESSSSTWGSWTNIASTTASDGSVSTTDFVINLDNQKEFDFEFKIADKLETITITRHVGQGQPQFFIGADGRTSVGGVPQIAMPTGNLGQLEVNGNAYANGNRLAELPITHDMLGSQCVKSNNIDFATLNGSGSWNGHIVKTTFVFQGSSTLTTDTAFNCVSNAGTAMRFGACNSGSGICLISGAGNVVRAKVQTVFSMPSSSNAEIGIIGIKTSGVTTWTRVQGILNGGQINPTEYSYGVDGTSSTFGVGFGTAIPNPGAKIRLYLNYDCVRNSLGNYGEETTTFWALMGDLACDGVKTYAYFDVQCGATSTSIPMLYQRGTPTAKLWRHIVEVYEVVS